MVNWFTSFKTIFTCLAPNWQRWKRRRDWDTEHLVQCGAAVFRALLRPCRRRRMGQGCGQLRRPPGSRIHPGPAARSGVAVVIAVEKATFLLAMQRVVGGVQVQGDLRRRGRVRLEEGVDEQPLDGLGAGHDLLVAGRAGQRLGGVNSRRFRVLLPARGLPTSRGRTRCWPSGSSLPTNAASRGSKRRVSWSLRSS